MKLLPIYKWIAGSQTDFTKPFRENEALFKQAQAFWNKLENSASIILLLFIVLGISTAVFYYWPYNNVHGRHYTPKHWVLFLAITFVFTFLITWGFEYFAAPSNLDGATMLQLKIALGNAIYASLLYFFVSFIWCNALPTNAYRLFKL